MNKMVLAGVGAGIISGYLIKKGLDGRSLSPERALTRVKSSASKVFTIDGAWIFLSPEEWTNGKMIYQVYRGGLTESEGDEIIHYDFIADAATGTLLSLDPQ